MIDALVPMRTSGRFDWLRLGSPNDGGYVVANTQVPEELLSFGGGSDIAFERQMADRGVAVTCADPLHTDPLPPDGENPRLVRGELGREFGAAEVRAWRRWGDSAWLKIDCEGAEWDLIGSMPSAELARFEQIVIEFHGLPWGCWEQKAEALERLRHRHELIHLHANNHGGVHRRYGCPVPDTVECTFLVREQAGVPLAAAWTPCGLDAPNNPRRREIDAGELVAGWRAWLESTY